MGLTRPRFEQINSIVTTISDPITVLNKGSTQANIDIGFIFNRDGGISSNVVMFWDESANTFITAFTTSTGSSDANITVSEYANLRINTLTADTAAFSSNGAIKIPSGNTLQRTSGTTGEIRFNTTTSQFEGYQGASWSSLGGVRSVDNATYIIAESYPGAGNNALYFYTDNTLRANLSSTGLNLSGNVLATTGTFSGVTVNGNESVTGYLNVTGNLIATRVTVGSVESTGVVYANSTATSTSTSTGALRVAGGIGVAGNVWADQVYATNNSNGKNFRIGDDAWLGDVSIADTAQLMGVQNSNKGYLRFGNVGSQTLGRDGSGPLSWTGNLNITGNILAANINASYFVGSGSTLTDINSFGNIFVSGQSPVLADNTSDTLTLVAGSGITITTDAANDSVTFTTVSTLGAFAADGDFGLITDTATITEDEGLVTDAATVTYDLGALATTGPIYPDALVVPTYTVTTLPSATTPAQVIYVSNESGGAVLAFSDGTNWRRVTDRAIVS